MSAGGNIELNWISINIISTVQILCSNSVSNTVVHSKHKQRGHTLYIVIQLGGTSENVEGNAGSFKLISSIPQNLSLHNSYIKYRIIHTLAT